MIYGSICSGIEAASVAWHPLGWEPAFFAEIDPFPCAVLKHRFPHVPNWGDFTTIESSPRPVRLLVGGTPCQSFSVAGRRLGLDDPRGNLALVYLRVVRRARPRWMVYENVPGLLSSAGGDDFAAFLSAASGWYIEAPAGGWKNSGIIPQRTPDDYGLAYRVLDAQHFGVPQRRRRVFVVGYLGDWRRAAAVLFERHSLSGNPPPRREAGAGIARGLATGTNPHRYDGDTETFVTHTLRADGFDASEDGTGRGTPLVPVAFYHTAGSRGLGESALSPPLKSDNTGGGAVSVAIPFIINAAESCAKASHARRSEVARRLDSTGSFADAQGGTVVADPPLVFANTAGDTALGMSRPGVPPITTRNGDPGILCSRSAVRRLTPREAERLQGLPDDWTLVPYRGKPAADGPRYKSIGNSMCVNVMRWIGERITLIDALAPLETG